MATSTLCNLLKITRVDTTEIGLTDLDIDVVHAGNTYLTAAGYTPTSYSSNDQLSVNNVDIEGVLATAGVQRADIAAGLYDGARIDWYVYDYEAATLNRHAASGHWGEASIHHGSGKYVAEFRGLTQKLQQNTGEVISSTCLAKLGDSRCGVNVALLTVTGDVDSASDRRNFIATELTEAAGYWNGGLVTFTSGDNDTYSMEVKSHTSGGNIELFLSMPNGITATDTFSIEPGCDLTLATCRDTYDNVINRRAFDFLPGSRELSRHIGTL